MRMTTVGPGLALFVALALAGCGQDTKKENAQLKVQVATLQKENVALKGESTSLRADAEAMKKQMAELTKEKQGLEERVKELQATIAAKPSAKPPQKPKKMSLP
jgi:predicted nuclease with TOPRIM domain